MDATQSFELTAWLNDADAEVLAKLIENALADTGLVERLAPGEGHRAAEALTDLACALSEARYQVR